MTFPNECYDTETLELMTAALEPAWAEVRAVTESKAMDCSGLRTILALRIMAAVKEGERDKLKLTELALTSISELY